MNLKDEYFTSGARGDGNGFLWCSANSTSFGENIFWNLGEPSFISESGVKEDCASILLTSGAPNKNVFSDVECSGSMKYICEVLHIN